MVKLLAIAALVWPLVLGGALVARVQDAAPTFVTVMYVAASRICHQRENRSFHAGDVKWPVCGRCSGLYLGGAAGALIAVVSLRRRRATPRLLTWLAMAAVPTTLTVVLEWTGVASVGNLARALTAVPLGAMVALVILQTAAGTGGGRDFSPAERRV